MIQEFFSDILKSPCISLFILLSLWLFVKISLNDWSSKSFSFTRRECFVNYQWWRIFTAPLCHISLLEILSSASALWSIRFLEHFYGSEFVFKYSLILLISIGSMTLWMVNLTSAMWRDRSFELFSLEDNPFFSSTSLVLAWLGFLSIDTTFRSQFLVFYLFGFIPIPISISPIILMLFSQCYLPRSHNISYICGLLTGYLLSFGVFKLLPNAFWTYCFYVDTVLLMLFFYKKHIEMRMITLPLRGESDISVIGADL